MADALAKLKKQCRIIALVGPQEAQTLPFVANVCIIRLRTLEMAHSGCDIESLQYAALQRCFL
jgi:hypothetical protein